MKIKIIQVSAVGPWFANLTPESEHEVIKEVWEKIRNRRGELENMLTGYWVLGVGEPVVVLLRECEILANE